MQPLHMLYLESIFGFQILANGFGASEFTGNISMDEIDEITKTSGSCFWQNPDAPHTNIAYLHVPVDGGVLNVSIDPTTNTIVVTE